MNLKRSRILNIALGHKQSACIAQRWCSPALAKSSDQTEQLLLQFVQGFQRDYRVHAALSLNILINCIKEASAQRLVIFVNFQVNLSTKVGQIFEDDGVIDVGHNPSCWRDVLRGLERQVLALEFIEQLAFVEWCELIK